MSYNSTTNLAELARKGGFTLNEGQSITCDTIDWRFIASVDTTRIVKESEFEKLDECIPFLIKSSFGQLFSEVRILDPAIAKIYVISQLAIQYLLFCTKFLDKSVQSSRENIFNYQTKIVRTEETLQKQEEEIDRLKDGIHELENRRQYSCTKCSRTFANPSTFESHMLRDHQQEQKELDKDSNLINTIKLELEVKKLKERLNITEKELMQESSKTCQKCLENSKRRFEHVAVQSNFEEKEKDDTEKEAIQETLNAQMQKFEEWKRDEELYYRNEMEQLREKFEKTINEVKENYEKKSTKPPEPAPRVNRPQQPTNADESLWKTRFEELEKMYKQEHAKLVQSMKSMEMSHQEKMKKIEKSMEQMRVQTPPATALSNSQEKLQRVTPEKPAQVQLQQSRRHESPKVLITVHEESSSEEESDEVELIQEALKRSKNTRKTEVVEQSPPAKKREVYSEQKFDATPRSSKTQKLEPKLSNQMKHENAQKIAEKMFAQRMKTMGIPAGRESLTNKEFAKIQSNLVVQRDKQRKKHPSFFITRQKIQSKVDSIFSTLTGGNPSSKSVKKTVEIEQPRKTKPTVSSQVDRFEKQTKKNSTAEIEETKPIRETSPAKPVEPEKIHFRDELERLIHQRRQSVTESAEPPAEPQRASSSKIPQPTNPAQSSKKVLFDLDKSPELLKVSRIDARDQDDSDFDISSFTSFEK